MRLYRTREEMRAAARVFRAQGAFVGLVPTMGYLHEGHMELVRRARAGCEKVVVSIFVNPTQFGPNEDFDAYPRDTERDLKLLSEAGVDTVFLPDVAELYPPGCETIVEAPTLSRILMGRLRPGHFRGVTTIVAKLFNIVRPDRAYFGEKDYQQLQIIRRMVQDLDFGIEIAGVPTMRERDGLAMSSRNVLLTPEDRAAAPVLNRALDEAEALARGRPDVAALRKQVKDRISAETRAEIRSVDLRDAETLAPLRGRLDRPAVILLAVRFGKVLLIDQRVVTPEGDHE
ncbi:pantoate--beta-alanine ligase [Alkalilacustris brevis]|uniref:pantoate--beta-alanine ligase n=1 Tax=Alkalilacustris brevis TaxID=2026338 RepID=UPI000E0D95DB|nr:pantoate--beta-alanine ligase [Alkalilacustris brevis]